MSNDRVLNTRERIVGVVALLVVSLFVSVLAALQAGDCRPDDSETIYYIAIIGAGLAVAAATFIAMTTRLRWRVVAALALGPVGRRSDVGLARCVLDRPLPERA
jgi:hypothetical protein